METRCQKCGADLAAGQAFCPKCGAVVGMSATAPRRDEGWDMASTVVGQQLPPAAVRPRPSAERQSRHAAQQQPPPTGARAGGNNTVLLAVVGFVAVLLIGGLLILLLYLNSQG